MRRAQRVAAGLVLSLWVASKAVGQSPSGPDLAVTSAVRGHFLRDLDCRPSAGCLVLWGTTTPSTIPGLFYHDFLVATPTFPSGIAAPDSVLREDDNALRGSFAWSAGRWKLIWDANPFLKPHPAGGDAPLQFFSGGLEPVSAIRGVAYPGVGSAGTLQLVGLVQGRLAWLSLAVRGLTPPENVPTLFLSILDAAGARAAPATTVTHRPDKQSSSTGHGIALAADRKSLLVTYYLGSLLDTGVVDVYSRRFDLDGHPLGPAFLVNQSTAGLQWLPTVTAVPSGFWVAWEQQKEDSVVGGVFLRKLDLQGQPLGAEVKIDQEPVADPSLEPMIASDEKGNFLVVWKHFDGSTFDRWDVKARLFRADGSAVSREIIVNHARGNDQERPLVAYANNGTYIVGWEGYAQFSGDPDDFFEEDVFVRRFSASPGDEVCQASQGRLRCDTGRTGGAPEVRHDFGITAAGPFLLGDVDGDGRADPCEFTGQQFRCDTDHEGGKAERRIPFGGAGIPLLGDVDGDGKADPCLYAEGRFSCDTKRDGGTGEWSLSFGAAGAIPLLGDVNGDGRDDACAYQAGSFRCRTATTGPDLVIAFGLPEDEPLLGDFDGDGDDEPCVYRVGTLLCDTYHDGGTAEGHLVFGSSGARIVLGNLDGL